MTIQQNHQEDESTLRLVVESVPVALLAVNAQGEITLANRWAETLFGYSRQELLGRPIDMLVPERFRSRHSHLRAGFFTTPSERAVGASRDLYGLRKDGSEVPVEIGLTPIHRPDGMLVAASIIDISDRRRMERERVASEQRYMDLVEQAADGIWVRDSEGRMRVVNQAACRLLGYSKEELLASAWLELVHATDRGTTSRIDALKPHESLRIERIMRHKDGHAIPTEASVHRKDDGSVEVITHDITERLQTQIALRALPRQLLAAQEQERRRIARELHDEVGQLLTAINMKLEDLGGQLRGTAGAAEVAEISELAKASLQQVRALSLDLRPAVLDFLGLADAIRWFLRERVPQGHLQVELDIGSPLPRAPMPIETAMFRTFQSAVTNVLRHAEARSLRVSLRYQAAQLILEMRDDGKGFDVAEARRRAQEGASLGLLGMEEWIRLSGGEFVIESNPGHGTTVRVCVPVPSE
jgi:PAS domain S-box-containing protein